MEIHILSIQSSVDGNLSCFYFLANVNSCSEHLCMRFCLNIGFQSFFFFFFFGLFFVTLGGFQDLSSPTRN